MRPWILTTGLALAVSLTAFAQNRPADNSSPAFQLVSLREDMRLLQSRVGELALAVEELTRENAALKAKTAESYATVDQLNKAVADINRTIQAGLADQKRDILQQVAGQMERLGKQTNAALDSLAKSQATRPPVQTSFSDNFPKEGINYTVQTGDSLAVIARKNNAKLTDIINANKITDPSRIQVGQTLFIPLAK